MINPKFDEEKKVKAIRIRVADTDAENHPHLAGNARINVSSPTAPKVEYGLNNSHSILLESTTGHFEDNQNYCIIFVLKVNKFIYLQYFIGIPWAKDFNCYTTKCS